MPYLRRGLESRLRRFAAQFKVVLLTGARQVGKSTLLEHLFPQIPFFVFDPLQDNYGARRDPDFFLDQFPPPVILDEIQYAPELLPAIKRRVDRSGKPGDYLLSGSQHLSLLRDVSESMAGRVGILELGSMTRRELTGCDAENTWLAEYLQNPSEIASSKEVEKSSNLLRTVWRGTMPGTLDISDEFIPDWYRSYAETYIERDIRRQGDIRDAADFMRFSGILNTLSAQELNIAKIARDAGIAPQTARKWMDALEGCFQWRTLQPWSGNSVKRLSLRPKGYARDCGLAAWFQRLSSPEALASHPGLGSLFETLAVNDILNQAALLPMPPRAWCWRTSAGAEVDLVLERDGFLYPIEIKCKSTLNGHDVRGLSAFAQEYGNRVKDGVIVYAGKSFFKIASGVTAVPWDLV